MNIRADISVQQKGDAKAFLERLSRQLTAIHNSGASVKVGLPAGHAPQKIIEYAFYNHEGTSRGIEPRPFISIAMHRGRGRIQQVMRAEAKAIFSGRSTIPKALRELGEVGRDEIKKAITSNIGPPNSREWSQYKGFKKTLIYKGDMRRAITWALE